MYQHLSPKGVYQNPKLKGAPNQGLFAATLGFFVGFAAVSLYGPTAKLLKVPMELNSTQVGLLVAMPMLSGSLARIPFGAWVDKCGGKKPLIWLLSISAVGMAGLLAVLSLLYPEGLSTAFYPLVLFLGFLAGFGIATFSVGIGQTSYWFPQRRQGSALGAYAGFGNTAPGLFAFLIPVVVNLWTITGAYALWLIFLVAGTAAYILIARDAYFFQLWKEGKGLPRGEAMRIAREHGQELFPSGRVWQGLASAAREWRTWLLVALYFTSFGGFLALTAWFPSYWGEFFGLGLGMAGTLTMVYSVLTSLVRVPGGILSDRIGGEATVILAFSTFFAGSVIMMFAGSVYLALFGAIVMALGMGLANAGVFKLVPKYLPQVVGGGAGWIGGLGAFGGFAIPPIMGMYVEAYGRQGYPLGFMVFLLLSLLCLATAWWLRLTSPRPREQEAGE